MNLVPGGHVYISESILFADGNRIFCIGGGTIELQRQDAAILNCIHRGESEIGLLCQSLSLLELGGDPMQIGQSIASVLSSPGSLLEYGPPIHNSPVDVIVCDFDSARTPINGRALVQALRKTQRVLFLGLKEKVASTSDDSFWLEKMQLFRWHRGWFQFAQWVRSTIRFHQNSRLVLMGHRDAILFGDLADRLSSVLILDPGWPAATTCQDVLGDRSVQIDLISNLRGLFYALRFSPYTELLQINRNASSAFAAIELHALKHADVICYSQVDQVDPILRVRDGADGIIPVCLPDIRSRASTSEARAIIVTADVEPTDTALAPLFGLLMNLRQTGALFDRIVVDTHSQWLDLVQTATGMALVPSKSGPESVEVVAVLIPLGVLRDLSQAVRWMTSSVPTQLIRASESHPLEEDLPEFMFMKQVTVTTLVERIRQLLDAKSNLRHEVLEVQSHLARKWSVLNALRRLTRE